MLLAHEIASLGGSPVPAPFSSIYGAAPGNTTFVSGSTYYSALADQGTNGGSWTPFAANSTFAPQQASGQILLADGNKHVKNSAAASAWNFLSSSSVDSSVATYYARVYVNATTDGFLCYNQTNSSNLGVNFGIFSGALRLQLSGSGSATNIAGGSISAATVYDLQFVRRTSTTWEVWVNGSMTGSATRATLTTGNVSDTLTLGHPGSAARVYVKCQQVWKGWAATSTEIAAINAQGAALFP